MKRTQIFDILEAFKHYVGLGDYKILISSEYKSMTGTLATVEACELEKTLKIVLSEAFKTQSFSKQRNILIHELIHSRVLICNNKCQRIIDCEEEDLVNDLTRGFETMKIHDTKK